MLKGIDFSFGSGLTVAEMKAAGVQFVCRYLSTPGNPKNIDKVELDNYLAAAIQVVFVFETTGTDMVDVANGVTDARLAQEQLNALNAATAPVFFAADEQAEPDLVGYFNGVNSVLGKARVGVYGGVGSVSQAFNAGVVSYGWQTYAWSSNTWDGRALLRQYLNGFRLGPADVDLDEAGYWNSPVILGPDSDYGQWPRPHPANSTTVPNVVNKDVPTAQAALISAGLANRGLVNAQSPAAGLTVAKGSEVALTVR